MYSLRALISAKIFSKASSSQRASLKIESILKPDLGPEISPRRGTSSVASADPTPESSRKTLDCVPWLRILDRRLLI
jgi:hypothetical protein